MKQTLITLALVSLALTGRADFTAQVNALIPQLADAVVTNRNAAQLELQAIAANASRPSSDATALGAVLAAKAADASVPQPARVWFVRQLEYIGKGEAVPALAQLLNDTDTELRECARRALEKNPDPKAADALRAALQKGGDTIWKIGLARSLGQKRDATAVPLIAGLLNDPQVAPAAAKSLGRIASPAAIEALWGVFDKVETAPEALACAANYLQSADIAGKLYRQSKLSPIRAAALAVLSKTDPKAVEEALLGNDVRLQKAAVDAASPATLAPLIPKLTATAKVFVLGAIDSEKAVLACAADNDESVRIAALEALMHVGTAAGVPALIQAATTGAAAEKSAAVAALARINGSGAGEAIAKLAGQGDSAVRLVAIAALAARVDKSQAPALLRYAGESDAVISKAAFQAVAKIGGDESLDELVKFVLAGKPGAKDALQAVAGRSADKSVVSRKLTAQAKAATGPQLNGILDVLALVGGADGLRAIVEFTGNANDEIKDGAVRALCQWREFGAVKPLLDIAGSPSAKQVHQVLAIQAVCRLVKGAAAEPAEVRVDAALTALKAAARPQEKTQAVSALAAIKNRKAADALIKLLSDPDLKTTAGHSAISLAQSLPKQERGTARKLAEAVKKANLSPDLTKKAEQLLNKK